LELSRYQGWVPFVNDDAALQFIDSTTALGNLTPGKWWQIGIALCDSDLESDKLIGDIGLFTSDHFDFIEMGITLSSSYHGNGYAYQSLSSLLQNIFHTIPSVQYVKCVVDTRNISCIKLLKRLNMVEVSSETVTFKGEICEEVTYQINKSEFAVNKSEFAVQSTCTQLSGGKDV
jgi:RimJ/RimL family protein N-acetyltransferase